MVNQFRRQWRDPQRRAAKTHTRREGPPEQISKQKHVVGGTPRKEQQQKEHAHSARPWIASHIYHRFSYCEFCDQRHVDAHRTLPSSLCGLALPGGWPSSDHDNTREMVRSKYSNIEQKS